MFRFLFFGILCLFVFLFSSCAPAQPLASVTDSPVMRNTITWRPTALPSLTVTPSSVSSLTVAPSPLPSSTLTPSPINPSWEQILFVEERTAYNVLSLRDLMDNTLNELLRKSGASQASWSPDGSKILYTLKWNGGGAIYIMNTDGSEARRISHNNSDGVYQPVWSPDGQKIAFYSNRTGYWALYFAAAPGYQAIRLTDNVVFGSTPSWSPDSRWIAYTAWRNIVQPGNIYLVDIQSRQSHQLISSGYGDYDPTWSPDGQTLAFVSLRTGVAQVYAISLSGGGDPWPLTGEGVNFSPTWSPDGAKIAFVSTRDDVNPETCQECEVEIYSMKPDGSEQNRLTNSPGIDWQPAWSPDGKKLAFVSLRHEANPEACEDSCNSEVYVIDLLSGQSHHLTENKTPDIQPVWRPNLSRAALQEITAFWGDHPISIFFPTTISLQPEKIIAEMETSTVVSDKLSPDGPWILYSVDAQDYYRKLYIANIDGSGKTWIANLNNMESPSPQFAGKYLAYALEWPFHSDPDLAPRILGIYDIQQKQTIHQISVVPSHVIENLKHQQDAIKDLGLTESGAISFYSSKEFSSLRFTGEPSWSPDDRYLAYTAVTQGPSSDVYVFSPETGAARRLTDGASQAILLGWSPDARWIIHSAWQPSQYSQMDMLPYPQVEAVWAARADGNGVVKVCDVDWRSEYEWIVGWLSSTRFIIRNSIHTQSLGSHGTRLHLVDLNAQTCRLLYEGSFEDVALDPQSNTIFLSAGSFVDFDAEPVKGVIRFSLTDTQPQIVDRIPWYHIAWYPELNWFIGNASGIIRIWTPAGQKVSLFEQETRLPVVSDNGAWLAFTGRTLADQGGIRLYDQNGVWVRHILPDLNSSDGELIWAWDSSGFWFLQKHEDGYSYQNLIWYTILEDRAVLLIEEMKDWGLSAWHSLIYPRK